MGKFLSIDSRFSEMMRHVMFFILTNILWLLCCLPVVTIFLSSGALLDCVNAYDRTGDPDAWRRFFPALRRDWKQGLLGGVLLEGVLVLMTLSVYSLTVTDFPFKGVSAVGIAIVGVVWFCIAVYFPVLLAQFENSTIGLFKVACLIGLRHLLSTLALFFILAVAITLCSVSGFLLPIWSFGGFSLTAYGMNLIYRRVLVRYGAKEYVPRGFRIGQLNEEAATGKQQEAEKTE